MEGKLIESRFDPRTFNYDIILNYQLSQKLILGQFFFFWYVRTKEGMKIRTNGLRFIRLMKHKKKL